MPDIVSHPENREGWRHFTHVADIGVHGFGVTPDSAFEQAALALTAIVTDPATVRPEKTIDIRREAPEIELLLVDWLNAVIFEMVTRKMLFSAFTVKIEGNKLHASASGEQIRLNRHQPTVEPKGATLSELSVGQRASDGMWHVRCVVDV